MHPEINLNKPVCLTFYAKFNKTKSMKKIITLFLLTLFGFGTYSAQEEGVMKKGNSSVNLYYGVNIFTGLYKNFLATNAIEAKYKQIGPMGIVYEYLVTDGIGIGAEFGYSGYSITFKETYSNSNGTVQTYDWEYKWSTLRAMFRANFHFAKSDNFDAYGLVSAGYRQSKFSFTSNDPGAGSFNQNFAFVPFGIKPGVGLRYFFTKNVGINLELAIGTPIICGGLSFKF